MSDSNSFPEDGPPVSGSPTLEQAIGGWMSLLRRLDELDAKLGVAASVARAVRTIGDDPIMQRLAPLGAAIVRAREIHPEGASLVALLAEAGEAANARLKGEPNERFVAECIDVAVVAMRLAYGEEAP